MPKDFSSDEPIHEPGSRREDYFIAHLDAPEKVKALPERELFDYNGPKSDDFPEGQIFFKESDGQIVVRKEWDDEINDWTQQGLGFHMDNFEDGREFVEEVYIANTIDQIMALPENVYFLYAGSYREIENFGKYKQFIFPNTVYHKMLEKSEGGKNGEQDVFLTPVRRINGEWKGFGGVEGSPVFLGKQQKVEQDS